MEDENIPDEIVGTATRIHILRETDSGTYYGLNIRPTVGESLGLESGDVVEALIRTPGGKSETITRKANEAGSGQYKIYIPKDVSDDLEIESGMLVDVFIKKT